MQSEKMFALVPSPIVVRPSVNVFAKIAKPQSVTSRAHLLATHAKQSGSSVDAELISSAPGRRAILIASVLAVTSTANPTPAFAAYGAGAGSDEAATTSGPVTFSTFYGAAAPPATYGTLGGTTKDKAKYSYDVLSTWMEEAPTKVEKGAGGQDSRWVLTGSRGATKCYCLTLNRAGEDGAAFGLTDKALNAIAGADAKLQEAITTGKITSRQSTIDGQDYTTYSVTQSTTPGEFSIKITVDNTGRLFAFVLTAPERTFDQERKNLTRMVDSFKTYNSVSQFV